MIDYFLYLGGCVGLAFVLSQVVYFDKPAFKCFLTHTV